MESVGVVPSPHFRLSLVISWLRGRELVPGLQGGELKAPAPP